MTKDEYLNQLKGNLQSLTSDEQQEALQYYSDYFDEAGDVQKVIDELGNPETLAKTIVEKFANVPVETEKKTSEDNNSNNGDTAFDALYYSFNPSEVKNISMSFGGAQIVAIPGKNFAVETRGISKDCMNCYLSSDGTLILKNDKRVNINFFSHDRSSRIVPRILLTLPEGGRVNRMKLYLGAGSFETRDINFKCTEGNVEVGAGNLVLKSIAGGTINFRCGMGNLDFKGELSGVCNIDCGMGSVKLNLKGNKDLYSYDAKVGLGDFRFNDQKRSGISQYVNEAHKDNHFSVNCGMGSVVIKVEE